ncbi:zinc ribbon domain-containing protein [Neobacillus niacini]|uniref:zinc ribbon domain-containing protein n=1 Tax=Neobacillus niacini TaxID=86668 RepID=UPI0037CC1433
MQKCKNCDQFWYPPAPVCYNCLSEDYLWEKLKGSGKVTHHCLHNSKTDLRKLL